MPDVDVSGELRVSMADTVWRFSLGPLGAVPTPSPGAMPAIEVLAETELSETAATIDFASIPTTYRHLRIVFQGRGTTAALDTDTRLRLNNDSANNYTTMTLGSYSSAPYAADLNGTSCQIGAIAAATAAAGYCGGFTIDIPNYRGTAFHKQLHLLGGFAEASGGSSRFMMTALGRWLSTEAIDRVTLFPAAGSFEIGTVATLYGLSPVS